jgi:hypothetical protein
MVKRWSELGFVFNVGTDKEPCFLAVERRLGDTRAKAATT